LHLFAVGSIFVTNASATYIPLYSATCPFCGLSFYGGSPIEAQLKLERHMQFAHKTVPNYIQWEVYTVR
jgi:hypothetical protein